MSTFSSYSGFLVAVNRLIDGDNVSASDIPTASLMQFVELAEKRIYREVRSRHNEKAFSALTTTSNLATLPTDFEACSIVHFGGIPLDPVPEEWIREYLDGSPSGDCEYFAEAGGSLIFGPTVADGTTVQGRYFYRHPDLTADTYAANTLIQKEPDLFLYATLLEGAPYMGQDNRVPLWTARYESIRDKLNADKTRAAYSAGRIKARPSTRLMG